MKRCVHCGGKFGLIRHRWYSRQFCSARCREKFLDQLFKDRHKIRRSLLKRASDASVRFLRIGYTRYGNAIRRVAQRDGASS
jgi:hypothetical protein